MFIKGGIRTLIDDGIQINNSLNVITERYIQLSENATINSAKVNKYIDSLNTNEEKKMRGWIAKNESQVAKTKDIIEGIRKYTATEEEQKIFEEGINKK